MGGRIESPQDLDIHISKPVDPSAAVDGFDRTVDGAGLPTALARENQVEIAGAPSPGSRDGAYQTRDVLPGMKVSHG
jgi:hypothetical protein